MGSERIEHKCEYCEALIKVTSGHIPRWCSVECRNYWLEEQEDARVQDNDV
jgi:hypothetical protein